MCTKFSALLKRFFENDVRSIRIDLLCQVDKPIFIYTQEYEEYGDLNMRVLKGLSARIPKSKIHLSGNSSQPNFGLPEGFAKASKYNLL